MNGQSPQSMYTPPGNGNGSGGGMYDDLEGQLFGPLPPYLQQGHHYDMNGSGQMGDMMSGLGQDVRYHTGITPGENEMVGNFDNIFTGEADDWGMLDASRFRQ